MCIENGVKQNVHSISQAAKRSCGKCFCICCSSVFSNGGVERIRTSAPVTQPNDLANRPLQPLEYHSIIYMAERVGFEPTHLLQPTGFQDRTLQPLEYLSISQQIYYSRWSLNLSNDGDCAILSYVATLFRYILKIEFASSGVEGVENCLF